MNQDIKEMEKCQSMLEKVINSLNHNVGIGPVTTLATATLWHAIEHIHDAKDALEKEISLRR